MNIDAVGQFIEMVFMPSVPAVAGGVIGLILALLLIILVRYFLPESLSL